MVVIGVTGGIAAGKSFVTRELGHWGAAVLEADRLGHAVLRLPEVKRALYQRWGKSVFKEPPFKEPVAGDRDSSDQPERASAGGGGPAGNVADVEGIPEPIGGGAEWTRGRRVDRQAVADRVFAPEPGSRCELAYLERLTHPLIGTLLARHLERLRGGGRFVAAVLDAPLLYKVGWDAYCDMILFVDAPWEVRAARAAGRGWSPDQLRVRQSRQPSLDQQRERADVIIDNGGAAAATTEQIERFWQSLVPDVAQ